MCIFMGVRKFGSFISKSEKRAICILSFLKKGLIIYLAVLKKVGYLERTPVICHI